MSVNNPFAPTPLSVVQNAANRFPEVASSQNDPYQHQQQQQQQYDSSYQQPQQQQSYQNQPQQQQQQYQPPQQQQQYTGFQPQSQFGAQLSAQMTGYPQPSPSPYQSPYSQQQQYSSSSSSAPPITDLDPYSNLSSLGSTSTSAYSGGGGAGGGGGGGSSGQVSVHGIEAGMQKEKHPRLFVNENKEGLMSWDEYSWTQLFSTLDALLASWESRLALLSSNSIQGADIGAVEALKKDTKERIDGIHAAKLQLGEVKGGWRYSTDAASKQRVRLALNAGLTSLPEYPPAIPSSSLGGSFAQRGAEEGRKMGIMQGYQQPQQTGYPQQQQQQMAYQSTGYQQPQQTGYPGQQMGYQQTGMMGYQQTGMGMGMGMGYPGQQGGQGGYY